MTTDDQSRPLTSAEWEAASRRATLRVCPPGVSCDLGQLVDISLGGFMVRTKRRLRDPIVVRIAAPGACLGLPAKVVWHRPICFRDHEYGLEFGEMTPQLRLMLQDLIGSTEPLAAPVGDEDSRATEVVDSQLAHLVRLWPHLPVDRRRTILALVRAA